MIIKPPQQIILAWFKMWNEQVFVLLVQDIRYLKENAVMEDKFKKFKTL
ncbi:hypothetical protein [Mycoplasmoides alvi]|nr:hypothetical protein [Mycoplasmoides alvi]